MYNIIAPCTGRCKCRSSCRSWLYFAVLDWRSSDRGSEAPFEPSHTHSFFIISTNHTTSVTRIIIQVVYNS